MVNLQVLRVGLAVGAGTGPELADVFTNVISRIAGLYGLTIQLERSSRTYHTYFSLLDVDDQQVIRDRVLEDVKDYENFCLQEIARGTRVIFRTAINAQSLYIVREHFEALKFEHFPQGPNGLLFVRDQAQGFYTGTNQYDATTETITRTCTFTKEMTKRIIAYSLDYAHKLWGPTSVDKVTMVYKFHLFDGTFSLWAAQLSKELGVKVHFVQPDTANRNLLAYGVRGRELLIAGNEWGDIMHSILLDKFDKGAQENHCTENIYLKPELDGLVEYQTVHGSADDIAGKELVNPLATIRAAAAILEKHGGCKGAEEAVERALENLGKRKVVTPDQGGQATTAAVMEALFDVFPSIVANGEVQSS